MRMKKMLSRFAPRSAALFMAALLGAVLNLHAQIPVILTGYPANDFTTTPPATDWSTYDTTVGAATTYATPADIDAVVQTLNASTFVAAVGTTGANGTARLARHNTGGAYLVTQPTGAPYAILMARLRNTSAGAIASMTVSYDYSIPVAPQTDSCPGQRVHYSQTGLPGSWILIPEFSGIIATGALSATLSLGLWPDNGDLFILILDDNNLTGTDGAFAIDNFAVSAVVPANLTAITITNSPASILVDERATASFTVVAGGSPRDYYWFSNGVQVAGNNLPTYTISNAAIPANQNAQIYVVISNALSFVTSATATLTVTPDSILPYVTSAFGNTDPTKVTLNFSEALLDSSVLETLNWSVYPTGGDADNDTLGIAATVLSNGTNVVVTTGNPRVAGNNYSVRITLVQDNSAANNIMVDTNVPLSQFVSLVDFDGPENVWKYFVSTNVDLFATDPTWMAGGFDDSAWLSGPAGLGADASVNGVPVRTPIDFSGAQVAANRFSEPAFFRRHFTMPSFLTNLATLRMRHVFEDGAVVYLNGQEAGRFNVGAGALTFATRATVSAADPTPISASVTLPLTNVVEGDNVIAVVVIQNGATSSDAEMALELTLDTAKYPSGFPVITNQPVASTNLNEGGSFAIGVTAEGATPLSFLWRKGGAVLPGQTGSSLSVVGALGSDSGAYDVIVSNALGSVTSSVANVTVVADLTGPAFLSAIADTNLTTIILTFGELLHTANAQEILNYSVHLTSGGGSLDILSAVLVNGTNVVLTTTPRTANTGYTIDLGGVTDTAAAANPATPISRPVLCQVIVLAPDDTTLWRYEASSNNLDGLGWELAGYNDSAWPQALAGFTTSNALEVVTNGFELRSTNMLSPATGGPITTYYRVPFNLPASSLTNVMLQIIGVMDDGVVAYINGVEAGRLRVTNSSPVSFTNLASAGSPEAGEVHLPLDVLTLTNLAGLVTGNNMLAIELHQNSVTSSDSVLSVQVVASIQEFSVGGPTLSIVQSGNDKIVTWLPASGILQQNADISTPNWVDVSPAPAVGGPHTNSGGGQLFFRVR